MWSTLVSSLLYLSILNSFSLIQCTRMTNTNTVLPTTIPDSQYEQVIAKRYLFAPFANESTTWPVLTNIHNVWQVVSLPQYYLHSAAGFWLLTEAASLNLEAPALQMCWMSLSNNSTSVVLSEIDANSYLVVSHNETTGRTYTAALISTQRIQVLFCDPSNAMSCRVIKTIPFPSILADISKVAAGLFIDDLGPAGSLYIATDTGLHALDLSTLTILPYVNGINVSVSSLAWSSKHQTSFIGTETKLWFYSYGVNGEGWRFEHINGLIDAPITSLVYNDAQDKLWIGQATGITLFSPVKMSSGRIHWYFSRLAGQISSPGSDIGHLPYANITTLSVSHSAISDSRVWIGFIGGTMRFNPDDDTNLNTWRVFNSARYMPNRDSLVNVSSLTVLSRPKNASSTLGSPAIAVTSKGLAIIFFEMWTLEQKAEHFQQFMNQPGRHDKYHLVSGCSMSVWGDTRTCLKQADDNDGLWTSMYLSSQTFRYAVTQDASVRESAWTHFEALELLNKVTGISGYPARSFAKRSDFPPDPHWHPSPINSTLQFKGDTSSDEIVGHELVYPLVHDLLASNDSERQRAYTLFYNITNHILTHDWYLVGEKHMPTSWGIWNPVYVNNNSDFQDDRGLNSLEILTYLLQTYAYSGDERFLNGTELLINSYQYDVNMINPKMIAVCDENFSDDELAYLSYFNFIYAINAIMSSTVLSPAQKERAQLITSKLLEYVMIGLDHTQKYKQMEKAPFFNFIYCYVSGQVNQTRHLFENIGVKPPAFDCNSLAKDGIWYLQRWPLELINWPQFNSDRLDIELNLPASCNKLPSSLQMLPPDERSINIWNTGVFVLDDGDGFGEIDPTAFLISYWGMRYANLLG